MKKTLLAILLFVMAVGRMSAQASSADRQAHRQITPSQIVDYLSERAAIVDVTPDSIFNTIRDLERMRTEASDSVAHAMLSECLGVLYDRAGNVLSQHNSHGDTLEEWGASQWRNAAEMCYAEARKPIEALHRTKAAQWMPLLTLMNESDNSFDLTSFFDGDLLHFLHMTHPTDDITAFYVNRVGGDASYIARLLNVMSVAGNYTYSRIDNYDEVQLHIESLFTEIESDSLVSDAAHVMLAYVYANTPWLPDSTQYNLCQSIVERYPDELLTQFVRELMQQISRPFCYASLKNVVYPNVTKPLALNHRNVDAVEVTIGDVTQRYALRCENPATIYENDTIEITIPSEVGRYKMRVRAFSGEREALVDSMTLYVSRHTILGFSNAKRDGYDLFAVDVMTGKRDTTRHIEQFDSTSFGRRERYVRIVGDAQPAVRLHYVVPEHNNTSTRHHLNVFTDRAIYRPGQRVQLSAIAYTNRHWEAHVEDNRMLPISVSDPSGVVIVRDTIMTDEFGVASYAFDLAPTARLGNYLLRVGDSGASIMVAEYKRPTYEVLFADSIVQVDATTGRIDIEVRQFNGVPLRNALVTGSITITHDVVAYIPIDSLYTDNDGRLSLFVSSVDRQNDPQYVYYYVSLSVTSPTAEVRDVTHTYRCNNVTRQWTPTLTRPDFDFECQDDTLRPKRPVEIKVRNNMGDVYLYYRVYRGDSCLMDVERHITDTLTTLRFDYALLGDEDGVRVDFAMMKNEKFVSRRFTLLRPAPDYKLRWHWTTFRDRVTPGTTERWTGTLHLPNGRRADANLMLTIYDASLDQFVGHRWWLTDNRSHQLAMRDNARHFSNSRLENLSFSWSRAHVEMVGLSYYQLNDVITDLFGNFYYTSPRMYRAEARSVANSAIIECVETDAMDVAMPTMAAGMAEDDCEDAAPSREQTVSTYVRSDFAETAYFASSLRTDSRGRLAITFTLPDCLTSWQLYGVAHTRDMHIANIEALTVAQKAFMAVVDLPRVVRQGDEASGTVMVQNIDGGRRDVRLSIEVRDAANDTLVAHYEHALTLVGDTVVPFSFDAVGRELIVRAVATDGDNSDGEQHLLRVLDDGEWVARAADLQCIGTGRHEVPIDTLFGESEVLERRMTIEYTEHPIWTAIDVLRNIRVARHDDVISLHTSLYANALLYDLAERYAEVKQHLNIDSEALQRDVLALDERLERLRNSDGGYGWFAGQESSLWMSLEVATTFARLRAMTNDDYIESIIDLNSLTDYLRGEFAERVRQMRQYDYRHASVSELQYLYVLALLDKPFGDDECYLLDLLLADGDALPREQLAIMTVVLSQLPASVVEGRATARDAVSERLRHYIVRDEHHGAYFSYLRGSFTSIDRKLLDHVFAMEAVRALPSEGDERLMSNMRRWLLQQKRVQAWDNPLHNASSVYALLLGDGYDLSGVARDRLVLDNDVALPVANGYVRDTLYSSTGDEHYATISVDKHSAGESWGAVYVEQRMPLSDVRSAENGLAIRAYVEAKDGADEALRVGSEAQIRIVITADRDYEYVHVAVPRAACLEPCYALPMYHCQGGLCYYQEVHDECDDLYIAQLPKGCYVLTIPMYVVHAGSYNTGVARIECLYAPEFCGNNENRVVVVE